jgi:hypothetical protein
LEARRADAAEDAAEAAAVDDNSAAGKTIAAAAVTARGSARAELRRMNATISVFLYVCSARFFCNASSCVLLVSKCV